MILQCVHLILLPFHVLTTLQQIYTVSGDGAVFTWKAKPSENEASDSDSDNSPITMPVAQALLP